MFFCFQIDIEKSLEDQGPFDMILHKFTDILVKSQQGYITEQRIMRSIEVNDGNQSNTKAQQPMQLPFDSFLTNNDFCCLLITFANSLDPDQDW